MIRDILMVIEGLLPLILVTGIILLLLVIV
jgi:hypothetical protein